MVRHPTIVTWFKPLFLAAVVWGVYWNSFHHPFVFDDWHVIPENPSIRLLKNIPFFFVDVAHFSVLPGNRDYRPVFLTSMALCWWLGGGTTLPFHLVSVAVHTGNVLMLFLICRRLFSRHYDATGGLSAGRAEWAAFLSAAVFAVHPLATESINYISAQSGPLAVMFSLIGFHLFLTAYEPGARHPMRRRWIRLLGSSLAYGLALLSKPIAIVLPLILLLWGVLFGKGTFTTATSWWARGKDYAKVYLPYVGISLAYFLVRQAILTEPFGGAQEIRPAVIHYITQTKAIVFYYLKLALIPMGLNADVEYPLSHSLLEPQVMASVAVILGLGGLLVRFRSRRNVVFWSLWFPMCLLLTTYGVILRQVVNEHRVYLSLAGLSALFGFLLIKGWDALQRNVPDLPRMACHLIAAMVLAALVGLGYETRARNAVWSSPLTLWEDAALHGGTWRAHMNYGLALEEQGRTQEAFAEFEEAVRQGSYAFAYINLGLAHLKRGDLEQGLVHLRTAVGLWPESPETRFYLGYGLSQAGKFEEAELELRHALRLRPNYVRAYRYLAEFYEMRGRWEEAVATLRQLHAADPTQSWVEDRIGMLSTEGPSREQSRIARLFSEAFSLQTQGNLRMAIHRYEELLALAPHHRQATFNLAYAYMQGVDPGDWARSARLFRRVLEIDPEYVEAIHHLATVSWRLGLKDDAVAYDRRYLKTGRHAGLRQESEKRLSDAHPGL